ncbi:MAG: hypothetical protein QOC80_273 [Frankiaceae bacterium]|nr:hypothetical protein [Frankiaceae bacterium]
MVRRYRQGFTRCSHAHAGVAAHGKRRTTTVPAMTDDPARTPSQEHDRRFDVEAVARLAMSKDPGLPSGLALRLAREAGEILRQHPDVEPPDLSRQLLAGSPETGATPANCVATAAIAHRNGAGAL